MSHLTAKSRDYSCGQGGPTDDPDKMRREIWTKDRLQGPSTDKPGPSLDSVLYRSRVHRRIKEGADRSCRNTGCRKRLQPELPESRLRIAKRVRVARLSPDRQPSRTFAPRHLSRKRSLPNIPDGNIPYPDRCGLTIMDSEGNGIAVRSARGTASGFEETDARMERGAGQSCR